jgi:hypothetical protein
MASIREMKPADYGSVMAVLERNGLGTASREDWLQLWAANPLQAPQAPMGWLLEDSHRGVVGTLSNLHLHYEWNQELIRAGVGFAWAVDPEFRPHSIGMLRRWMRQPNLDLLLTNTASPRVGEILSVARFRPVPHPEYDKALFWIASEQGFAASALRQLGIPGSDWLSYAAGPALRVLGRVRERRPPHGHRADVRMLVDFDARFDAFWTRLRRVPDRLMALRSAAALRWHFKRARDGAGMVLLALEEGGELTGYLVMVRQDHAAIGLTRYRVADLQALGGSPAGVRALIMAAVKVAVEQSVHVVEVVGLSSAKRQALASLSPLRRRMPSWLFFYRAADEGLAARLDSPSAWDPSPYDGDATL